MTDKMKKTEDEMTLEGAVEMKEEDLDQASGGAAFIRGTSPTEPVAGGLIFWAITHDND